MRHFINLSGISASYYSEFPRVAVRVLNPHRVIMQLVKIKVFSLKQLQCKQVREKFAFKCSRCTTDVYFTSNEEKLYLILGEGKWGWHHAKQQPASASGMNGHDK